MLFKNKSKKYVGILAITLSIAFFSIRVGPAIAPGKTHLPSSDITTILTFAGIITGVYLIGGPLPALIAMIPLVAGGCAGGVTGAPDLGEPPFPPSASISHP